MKNPIMFTTVTISDDDTVGIEARFADGQKYQVASIPYEHEDFAHWLSDELNAGKVPCFSRQVVAPGAQTHMHRGSPSEVMRKMGTIYEVSLEELE